MPLMSREAALHSPGEAEKIAEGTIELVHQKLTYSGGIDWFDPHMLQLRRYHLHYFDWAWAFANHPDVGWARGEFLKIWSAWRRQVPFGRWIPWHPYVASSRLWNLLGIAPRLLPVDHSTMECLWLHGDYVARNLELDVGGNHLVRNLRALVAAGLTLSNARWVDDALARLAEEVPAQILPDGGHFERSPYYHAQVLTDLTEVIELCSAMGAALPTEITRSVAMMRRYLDTLVPSPGTLPVFNDGARRYPRGPTPVQKDAEGIHELQSSGYVVARRGPFHLVMDVGHPAPRRLPAHGHCSLLSVELVLNGDPLLVNVGTSTYDEPDVRFLERSTAAHNTVRIDGNEQSEIWGTFRMGRQATPMAVTVNSQGPALAVSAAHDGYGSLPGHPVHHRSVSISDRSMTVVDRITGDGTHAVEGFWHISPSLSLTANGGEWAIGGNGKLRIGASTPTLTVREKGAVDWISTDFGQRVAAECLTWTAQDELPIEVTTTVSCA